MYERKTDDGYFIVSAIHRNDVAEVLGHKNAVKLTDDQMLRIARYMSDGYCEDMYWQQLKMLASEALGKEREPWTYSEDEE